MNALKLIFIDSTEILIDENSEISGLSFSKNEANYGSPEESSKYQNMFPLAVAEYPNLVLYPHPHVGMLQPVTELLQNYPYFFFANDENTIYASAAVIRIELIE